MFFYDKEDIIFILKPLKDVVKLKRRKNKEYERFIKAMKHDKLLADMEKGNEVSIEKIFET